MELSYVFKMIPKMLKYMLVTLELTFFSFILSLILGFILTMILIKNVVVLKTVATVWISFFRGTPLLAQLFLLYFGLVQIIPILRIIPAFWMAIIIIGFHYSAYMAVIMKSAVLSVEKGQLEACLSSGLTTRIAYEHVVLPQAARVAVPSLFSVTMDVLKGTSLVFSFGVMEMMAIAQIEAGVHYRYIEAYLSIIILYWFMNFLLTLLQKKIEVWTSRGYDDRR